MHVNEQVVGSVPVLHAIVVAADVAVPVVDVEVAKIVPIADAGTAVVAAPPTVIVLPPPNPNTVSWLAAGIDGH